MKIRFLLIALFQSLVSLAQLQKDFEPDYIIDRFYAVKEGGLYYEVKLENGSYVYGRGADSPTSLAKLFNVPESAIVPISMLRKVSSEKIFKELQGLQMEYALGTEPKIKIDVNFLYGLAVISGQDMEIRDQLSVSFYDLVPETVSGYTIINLYNFGSFVGRIYPAKEGYKLRMFSGYGDTWPVVRQAIVTQSLQKQVHLNFPATEIFTENNAYGLRLKEGKKTVVIPAIYDSIDNCSAAMVAAYNGRKPKLLYRNGDQALDGIRTFEPHSDRYTGVLKGNEVFYIDNEGNRVDSLPKYMEGRCGTVPHYTDSIVKMGGYYKHYHIFRYGSTRLTETVLAKASDFKDIRLINGSTISRSLTTAYYSPGNNGHKGFIVTLNNGAQSIIELKKDGTYKLSLEPDNYTFTYKEYEMDIPVRFKSNGLYGSWPQNNSARYKELSCFDKGFARFTLPDGTKGWLANNGREYLDE